MIEIICEHCKKPFSGRSNRKTCSVLCRRTLEGKRRFWDLRFSYVRFCEVQAGWDGLTIAQRAHWQKEGEKEREKLLKVFGNRP